MNKYSLGNLVLNALSGHRLWKPLVPPAKLREDYDVVIVGGGGHGLSSAYYLARNHDIRRIAVLEKGWIGGGNSGRNTQVIRSNYFWPESSSLYDRSLALYENLSRVLNFNVMVSQRGVLMLVHSDHEMEIVRRWANSIAINGVDVEMLDRQQVAAEAPEINLSARFPVIGGFMQRRGGIARHDNVVWAYARAAASLGVDIIQNCEVLDFIKSNGRVRGVRTSLGNVSADRVGLATAAQSSLLAQKAGFRLPLECVALQAMVSEPVKPALDCVVLSSAIHVYVSQTDRGEVVVGGGADAYPSYAQRGGMPVLDANIAALTELFPRFRALRLMRQWAGTVDITPDRSPIVSATPIDGLFINVGWGTGGFKAIPVGGETFAHLLATGCTHALTRPFGLDRFAAGRLIDEGAAASVAH